MSELIDVRITARGRKDRRAQVTCNCSAYPFPHRIGSAKCSGSEWCASFHLYSGSDDCRYCNHNHNGQCEVATGQEPIHQCDAIKNMTRR